MVCQGRSWSSSCPVPRSNLIANVVHERGSLSLHIICQTTKWVWSLPDNVLNEFQYCINFIRDKMLAKSENNSYEQVEISLFTS